MFLLCKHTSALRENHLQYENYYHEGEIPKAICATRELAEELKVAMGDPYLKIIELPTYTDHPVVQYSHTVFIDKDGNFTTGHAALYADIRKPTVAPTELGPEADFVYFHHGHDSETCTESLLKTVEARSYVGDAYVVELAKKALKLWLERVEPLRLVYVKAYHEWWHYNGEHEEYQRRYTAEQSAWHAMWDEQRAVERELMGGRTNG